MDRVARPVSVLILGRDAHLGRRGIRLGKTAHPLMQWGSPIRDRPPLRLDEDGWQWTEPQVGGLPVERLAAASALLIRHTSTPKRCVAALWDGFGWMRPGGASIAISSSEELEPAEVDRLTAEAERQLPSPLAPRVLAGPRLELPARAYFLFETDLTELGDPRWIGHERWGHSPTLLWPLHSARREQRSSRTVLVENGKDALISAREGRLPWSRRPSLRFSGG